MSDKMTDAQLVKELDVLAGALGPHMSSTAEIVRAAAVRLSANDRIVDRLVAHYAGNEQGLRDAIGDCHSQVIQTLNDMRSDDNPRENLPEIVALLTALGYSETEILGHFDPDLTA